MAHFVVNRCHTPCSPLRTRAEGAKCDPMGRGQNLVLWKPAPSDRSKRFSFPRLESTHAATRDQANQGLRDPDRRNALQGRDDDDWYTVAKKFGVNVQSLILYNFGTLNTNEVNWYLRHRVGCKVPSKWNWKFSASAKPGYVYIPPAPPVRPLRQQPLIEIPIQEYTFSIAALSWIDPRTGLPEVDQGDPGDAILAEAILANTGYRFANFLEATISVVSTSKSPMPIAIGFSHIGYTEDCGIYRSPSFLGIPSYAYPIKLFDPVTVDGGIEFRQIVAAGRKSPRSKLPRSAVRPAHSAARSCRRSSPSRRSGRT